MRKWQRVMLGVVFAGLLAVPCWGAETLTTVSVTSSTAGTQIVANIGAGTVVTVPSGSGAVWFAKTNGTCSTTLTSPIGYRVSGGNGWDFLASEDGYSGQLCGILESGSTAVSVSVNKR